MDAASSPPGDIGSPESLDDAQISEIVDQELATAVAAPDVVHVLVLRYRDDDYISVHTTPEGAQQRLQQTAALWGIPDILHTEQLTYRIEKLPIETP